jgi:hypothetical protein
MFTTLVEGASWKCSILGISLKKKRENRNKKAAGNYLLYLVLNLKVQCHKFLARVIATGMYIIAF